MGEALDDFSVELRQLTPSKINWDKELEAIALFNTCVSYVP